MRLTCPNCGAQYEVEDSVIPETGRDVQCSNCGHTWYQRPVTRRPAPPAAEQPAEPAAPKPEPEPADMAAAPEHDAEAPEAAEESAEAGAPAPQPQRRPLDEGVASILREEAEREAARRASEQAAMESSEASAAGRDVIDDAALKQKLAHLQAADEAEEEPGEPQATPHMAGRRDLLPDIEEINSTLTASADEGIIEPDALAAERQRRSGFRTGFVLAVAIFAVLALIYAYAPRLADTFPQFAGTLDGYVSWVNALRESVDQSLQRAVDSLTALVSRMSEARSSAG